MKTNFVLYYQAALKGFENQVVFYKPRDFQSLSTLPI